MASKPRSVFRWIALGGLGVVVALAALLAGFTWWLPRSGVARDLQATLSQRLGRQVALTGGVNVTLFPLFGVEARGFSIANIPGGQARNLVEAEAITVGLAPLSLLTGHVQIHEVSLTQSRVHLEKLADGRVNWILGAGEPRADYSPPRWLKDLSIDNLSIRSGQVAFVDVKENGRQALDDINVSIKLAGLDQPAIADGALSMSGEPARITLRIDNPRAVINGQSTGLHLALDSKPIQLKLDGAGAIGNGPMTGDLAISGPSLRDLARFGGKPLAPSPGLGPFSMKGQLEKSGQVIRLTTAQVSIDHLRATGDIAVDTSGRRPNVTGRVSMAALDMNPYLGPEAPLGAAWPTQPISLAGLRAIDADLVISAGRVQFRKFHMSDAALRTRITDGTANVTLERMSLYGGSGTGQLVAADTPAGARYGGQFQLRGVEAKALFSDLIKVDRITGAASGTVNLTASGGSVDAIMHSLSGQASMTVANGAVTGVDMASLSHNVVSAVASGAVGPNARTSFTVAGASFALSRGVAATSNLTLSGPGLAVSGVGSINLGERTLDMVVKPQGALKAAGRKLDLGAVPVHAHGPWAKLSYEPDLGGVAEKLIGGQLRQLGGDGGGGLGGLLQSLGGASPTPSAPPAKGTPPPKAKDKGKDGGASLLDQLSGLVSH